MQMPTGCVWRLHWKIILPFSHTRIAAFYFFTLIFVHSLANILTRSEEYALAALLEYLPAEGDIGEGVEIVADDLDDQHQNHQAL